MNILKKNETTDAHPYVPELKSLYRQGRISRREFLRNATLLGMSAIAASSFVAGCAQPTPTPAAQEVPPTAVSTHSRVTHGCARRGWPQARRHLHHRHPRTAD